MTIPDPARNVLLQWFLGLAVISLGLLLLINGRSFLIPIVVAFLVFSVLKAGIDRLWRISIGGIRLPYWLAASVGLIALAVGLFVFYSVLSGELLLMIA